MPNRLFNFFLMADIISAKFPPIKNFSEMITSLMNSSISNDLFVWGKNTVKMESLPTEILDHIFNHFPNKCEICQNKCLRALGWQELSKCSKTCERWNRIIEEIDTLEKCFSDFEKPHYNLKWFSVLKMCNGHICCKIL